MESKDPGGSITCSDGMNRRGPSTALRPPFRLRFAQDDTRWSFGTLSEVTLGLSHCGDFPAVAVGLREQAVGFRLVGEAQRGGVPFERYAGVAGGDVAELDGLGERAGVVEAVGRFRPGERGVTQAW